MSTYKPSERTHKHLNLPFLLVTEHSTAYCTKLNPCSLPLPFFRLGPEPMGRRTHQPYTKVHIHTPTRTHRHTCTNVYEHTQACRDTGPQQSASARTPTQKHTFKWHGNTFGQAEMTVSTSQPHTSQHWENSVAWLQGVAGYGACNRWNCSSSRAGEVKSSWTACVNAHVCACAIFEPAQDFHPCYFKVALLKSYSMAKSLARIQKDRACIKTWQTLRERRVME